MLSLPTSPLTTTILLSVNVVFSHLKMELSCISCKIKDRMDEVNMSVLDVVDIILRRQRLVRNNSH
jgi:hypothetical protein